MFFQSCPLAQESGWFWKAVLVSLGCGGSTGKYSPFLMVPAGLFLPPPHTESIVPFLAPTAAHAVLSLRSRAAALTCIPFGICSPLRIASWEARTGIQGIQGSQGSQEPKNRKTHQVTWLGARVSLLRFGNGSLAAPPGPPVCHGVTAQCWGDQELSPSLESPRGLLFSAPSMDR